MKWSVLRMFSSERVRSRFYKWLYSAYHLVCFDKLVTIVADIGVGHGRKWRFEQCGEWLTAFSEYVGEAGNVGKV